MLRLLVFLAFIIALASGLAWLADRPGLIVVNWEGYRAEISVFHAVVALAFLTGLVLVVWSLLRHIWESPAVIGSYFKKQRQKRGLDALSTGMIAIGAGDKSTALKYAVQARKSMPNEPLTHLLRAQAAQLAGDKGTARRIYESMLSHPDTEQLGLRGLFLEAEREREWEAAKQFAERAVRLNPQLSWPVEALFDLQCKSHDWVGAMETLAIARKNGHVEKASAERRRAVLLTAQAQDLEEKDPERALNLALDGHKLAPGLVPAAAIAGRLLASRGATPRATKLLQKTWQKSPHPDLATAYAYARLGDSPRDRLDRVRKLAQLNPHALESAIALANAAVEAKDYAAARKALEPLKEGRLTQRACTLMARIEGEEHGDKGAVREWLARAVNAPRDPAWTADGVVSETWAAVSPVTGALDAFQWRVPVESMEKTADEIVARKLEELVALGAPVDAAVAARDVTPEAAATQSIVPDGDPPRTGQADPAAATSASPTVPARTSAASIDDAEAVTVRPRAAKAGKAKPASPARAAADTGKPTRDAQRPAAEVSVVADAPPRAVAPLDKPDAQRQTPTEGPGVEDSADGFLEEAESAAPRHPTPAEERSMRAAASVRPAKSEASELSAQAGDAARDAAETGAKDAPGKETSSPPGNGGASDAAAKSGGSGKTENETAAASSAASTATAAASAALAAMGGSAKDTSDRPAATPGKAGASDADAKDGDNADAARATKTKTVAAAAPQRSSHGSGDDDRQDDRQDWAEAGKSASSGSVKPSAESPSAKKTRENTSVATLGNPDEAASAKQEPAKDAKLSGRKGKPSVAEARIFVSPRAPDDPGPEDNSDNDVPEVMKPYRVHS